MQVPGFIGATYQSQSVNVDAERCVNWYPEFTQPGHAKSPVVLYPCPGLREFAIISENPVRGTFYENGRMWAVVGPTLYEIFLDGTFTSRGTVANDNLPVTFSSNSTGGNQLYIVSGGNGYILTLTTNAFAQIVDPDFPAGVVMGAYLDGYFFALWPNSTKFSISALFDGTSWDALDVAQKQRTSDYIRTLVVENQEVWLLGEQNTEVWFNNGDPDFPFAPVQGVLINIGIVAAWSFKRVANALMWLGQDVDGSGVVYRAQGYAPVRVSNHAMEALWRRYATIQDAEAWAYQSEGHPFYVITFPNANKTYAFDVASGLWHERAYYNPNQGEFEAHLARNHLFAFNIHLVGSRRNGIIYLMSNSIQADAGDKIVRIRQAAHMSDEEIRLFYDYFQLDLETGTGGSGVDCNPQIMLQWSDDGGHTWSNEWWVSAGAQGNYKWRAMWRRLGHSRNRIWRITCSENTYWVIINAYMGLKKGLS